jgi:hypothetical protein
MIQCLKLAIHLKFIGFVGAMGSISYAMGQYEESRKRSIESDIRNGAPSSVICSNALIPAGVSKDIVFKDWAYSIARIYCPPGRVGPLKPSLPVEPNSLKSNIQSSSPAITCPLLSSHDAKRVARGELVKLAGDGCIMIFNGVK